MPRRGKPRPPLDPRPEFDLAPEVEADIAAMVWPQGEERRIRGYRAWLMRKAGLGDAEIAQRLQVQERQVAGLLQAGRLVAQKMEGKG